MKKLSLFQKFLMPKDALYVPSRNIFCMPPSNIRPDIACKTIYWSGFRWKLGGTELFFRDSRQLNKQTIEACNLKYIK